MSLPQSVSTPVSLRQFNLTNPINAKLLINIHLRALSRVAPRLHCPHDGDLKHESGFTSLIHFFVGLLRVPNSCVLLSGSEGTSAGGVWPKEHQEHGGKLGSA